MESFDSFFCAAFGEKNDAAMKAPFGYQRRLAQAPWPDLLNVPTGLGKTAAVVLAWLWKRGWRTGGHRVACQADTPRRLVICLPMRTLVEQTEAVVLAWLKRLGHDGDAGQGRVSVHVLMGGSDAVSRATWAEHPEEDMVLIGTQDMLLSRALMRGYGMSRYQWPVHFAWLHNDCLWVFDEVQLMGSGLPTSLQLDAFRRMLPLGRLSRSLWMSATLNPQWLNTVDMRPYLPTLSTQALGDDDREEAAQRLNATKSLEAAPFALTRAAGNKAGKDAYIKTLADYVLQAHDSCAQTLVIVNRVDRAQALFTELRKARPSRSDLLIHARFRPAERRQKSQRLKSDSDVDRIVVATQAIEAGVDVSSKVLVTELAPWDSMVQRFGRCNRYGEHNQAGARVTWVDIQAEADLKPYADEALASARGRLRRLSSVSAGALPPTQEQRPLSAVLRRKDLYDLFNTDPDLSGFDVDISDFIRDSDTPGLQVFWREFDETPNMPAPQGLPTREELCPVSVAQARAFADRVDVELWQWDAMARKWARMAQGKTPRPGMTLMARTSAGGYDEEVGFNPELKKPSVSQIDLPTIESDEETFSGDWRSRQNRPIKLPDHLAHVAEHADRLCLAVGESDLRDPVVRAGRWHDVGKAHEIFDQYMHACELAPKGFLAKSPCRGRHARPYFRHELASMLAWLGQHDGEPDADLIGYLVAAHHGKVRMSLRAMPGEEAPPGIRRFARGVFEGDVLPPLEFDGERSEAVTLKLALMEMGLGEQGPSWAERCLRLLDEHGPFHLAWLESLVRVADWRASSDEQK